MALVEWQRETRTGNYRRSEGPTGRRRLAEARAKLLKALKEFGRYIATNQDCIPDYGDRFRNDETITTVFVESTINQVVSHRMVKQMRWSQRGAHLLLQVRARVLNHELRETFCR